MQSSPAIATRRAPAPTPLEAALADLAVRDGLLKYAFRKTRHEQNAEDLVQATVEAALRRVGSATAWTGPPPPALWFLGSVMNGEVSNDRRTGKRRPKVVQGETEDAPSESPDAEQAMVGREAEDAQERERDEVKAELRAYFGAQPNGHVPIGLLDAAENGLKGRKTIADTIRCTVDELDNGRERLQHHLERVVKRRRSGGEAPS